MSLSREARIYNANRSIQSIPLSVSRPSIEAPPPHCRAKSRSPRIRHPRWLKGPVKDLLASSLHLSKAVAPKDPRVILHAAEPLHSNRQRDHSQVQTPVRLE
ncbi:hypothetical protein FOWG_10947 [Fusarium oxysporum f. sp. lycopersici MN25]|uniref:Uncharacterized protein n=1 Tax=Fusarium oxysporum Fo47 TaxID=660027 RepID=W9JU01_FUSOX|nr:hypothetical protein FOZG_14262 [Fusarium oxysporum Fo47]EWZ85870.1 hypothetical protein FOWG_10947 [Fusarium oxysporum f. sp. lycopersici MN25]